MSDTIPCPDCGQKFSGPTNASAIVRYEDHLPCVCPVCHQPLNEEGLCPDSGHTSSILYDRPPGNVYKVPKT